MGGNKEVKKNTTLIDQERARQTQEHNDFMNMATPRRNTEQGFADTTRGDILKGYQDLYKNSTGTTDMFGGNFGGSGGYTPQIYTPQLANTERASAASADVSKYIGQSADVANKLGQGGEWDPRIRQGYGDLATTGGYSENDISNIRNRAASQSPAFFDAVRNRMSQKANAAGVNQGSIFGAASDRLTRDSARQGAENSLNAELGLQDQIRQGKLSGLSGLTNLDTSSNQFRGQGMQGLLGAGNAENDVSMFNAGQGNQVSMFNAGQGNEMNRYNTSNINDASQYNISNANSAAAAGASAANAARSEKVREYMAGLSGMQDVYGSTPAELARQENLMMQERFGNTSNIGQNIGQRMQNNPRGPSVMDRIMQGAGIAGTIGAGIITRRGHG